MLSQEMFINLSLELDLFFVRIMKEHSFFLEAGFPGKDMKLARQADMLKNEFTKLLAETINLSHGVISPETLSSGEIVTEFTLQAERASEYYTGISIDTNITSMELSHNTGSDRFQPLHNSITPLSNQVYSLNQRIIQTVSMIIQYKKQLLNDVLSCKIFTLNYPLLIDHILREAIFFKELLMRLQNGVVIDIKKDIIEKEIFWNQIMAEHSKFIRGFLDPTEVDLFNIANNFGNEFDTLTKKAMELTNNIAALPAVTQDSLNATKNIKSFNSKATEGLINCKIKSIILPLLGDHVLREANHYVRLLKSHS